MRRAAGAISRDLNVNVFRNDVQPLLGAAATWVVLAGLAVVYVVLVRQVAAEPDLTIDDPPLFEWA